MANVIARTGRPALVLAPNKTLAAQLYAEFREFFPNNSVEYFVSYYDYYQPEAYVPSRDLYIEKDSTINEHIEQMRLSATKAILERPDCVIVATVSAIYGIGDPSEYHSMILHVKEGDKLTQRDAIKRLTEMQYTRNEADFRRGTFRVRGEVLDIFPAEHAENALRLSLFDDEVESLQLFDPLTGHIKQRIGRFTVFPSSHYVTGRKKVLDAIEAIKVELAQQKEFFVCADEADRGAADRAADAFRPRDDDRDRLLQGHRELLAPLVGAQPRRAAADADRLPAAEVAHVHRRVARDDSADGRHVPRRSRAQGEPRQLRLPAAVGARQPAASLRRVRAAAAADDLRVGDAGRLRAEARGPGGRAGGPADRPRRPDARGAARADAGRRSPVRDRPSRRTERAGAGDDADQADGRGPDRLPERARRPGPLPALGHRHRRARRDHPRPAPGRVRRAGRHQPAARRARHPRGVAGRRCSTPTRRASCAPSAR